MEKATRRYTPEGNHRLVLPTVPQGWRYFPTTDGIGVLAPRDAFSSVDHSPDGLETAEMHSQAVAALRAGYPGTALYYLREAYWWEWTGDPAFVREICWQLIATYQALRRPLLMLEVERRISEFYTEHGEVG